MLKKRKNGKMAIFTPKLCLNPFEKMPIFQLFKLLLFIAYEGIFFVLEYHKRHFPGLYCLKKKTWNNGNFWTKTIS